MAAFFENENTDASNEHYIWVEKYRPKTFDTYLGNESLKDSIAEFLKTKQIPNMLFHSRSPGTGKTSLAKLLARNIDSDCLYINAADETGIDNIRNKVTNFASTLGFNSLKILILDECQRMSEAGQRALLNVMESHSKHTRFILTCNDVERLIQPLVSRCQVFHIQPPSMSEVAKHVAGILDNEGVEYEVSDFKILMKYYPDIRRIIQTAQQKSIKGKLQVTEKEVIDSDSKLKLIEILKGGKSDDTVKKCRQLLADTGTAEYSEYYTYLYDHIDEYAPNAIANTISTIAEFQNKDSVAPNKEINFAACLIAIVRKL